MFAMKLPVEPWLKTWLATYTDGDGHWWWMIYNGNRTVARGGPYLSSAAAAVDGAAHAKRLEGGAQ